ncbi:glycerate kinase, partial [Salmonella enterica]|uniref:glycerate kinase n=1 Tax=Salmonella enterica TaxID=28901 RepID=UPI00149620A7
EHIIIGIGGSGTQHGGAGVGQGLGGRGRGGQGNDISPGGLGVGTLASIYISGLGKRFWACHIEDACDVTKPLTGQKGASAGFG